VLTSLVSLIAKGLNQTLHATRSSAIAVIADRTACSSTIG